MRRNPTKSILDYDSPKSNRSNRIINYDSILNSNNVEYTIPKSITDLDYGLPKSCIDYQSNHNTPARSMAIVSDGEVVVFDDIDDNWQGLRLDLASSNTNQITAASVDLETDDSQRGRIAPEPPSSSVGSTPSPTTAYHRNTSEFFKVMRDINAYIYISQYCITKRFSQVLRFNFCRLLHQRVIARQIPRLRNVIIKLRESLVNYQLLNILAARGVMEFAKIHSFLAYYRRLQCI